MRNFSFINKYNRLFMGIEKLFDFLRHLIIILLIVYLTRKVFLLEDKVEELSNHIKLDETFEEEYSTDNDLGVLHKVSSQNSDAIPIMINMPSNLNYNTSVFKSKIDLCRNFYDDKTSVEDVKIEKSNENNDYNNMPKISEIVTISTSSDIHESVKYVEEIKEIKEIEEIEEIVEEPIKKTARKSLKDLQAIATSKNIDIKNENGKLKTMKELKAEINI